MCEYCHQAPHHPRCPNADINYIGSCACCHEPISLSYECYTDFDDNLFCSEECAIKYYGIREIPY